MTIATGSRLGPYEITGPLGAGGMGEVWRARDTRLDRSVAIKVLPAELANNAQLRLRLEREAKSISQLNHPHICTLYDIGSENGLDFLVMEMLEGQSLADRLLQGAMPPDQVIRYGIEIAQALDRAHKAGIVHRDLKPGNVMLTKSGAKLLDFGLAKPAFRSVVSHSNVTPDDATAAAIAGRPLTEEGTIVGTFQYMAPEQIEGHEADARTDIFALGSVLYEMATGRRAFSGKSKASLIANILATEPPPLFTTQPALPPGLDRIIRLCLAKDPDERWQSAHDVAIELRDVRDVHLTAQGATTATMPRRRERIAWLAAALALIVAATSAWIVWNRAPPLQSLTIESAVPVPDGSIVRWPRISPDGTKLALMGLNAEGEQVLFLRDMASGETTKLTTSGLGVGGVPEWSPDSSELLLRQGDALVRYSPASGAAQVIARGSTPTGFSWGGNGVVLIATGDRIDRVTVGGGARQTLIKPDLEHGEQLVGWPAFLPDGKHFLYISARKGAEETGYSVWVSSLDATMRKELVPTDTDARYANGVLLFGRGGKLMGQHFDPATLALSGDARVIANELIYAFMGASAGFSVSNNGLLVYRRASSISAASRLSWYDLAGHEVATLAPLGQYWDLSLSRDGRTLAVQVTEPQKRPHLWSFDISRAVGTLLTPPTAASPNSGEATPVWMPDGRSLLYAGGGNGIFDVCRKSLDGQPTTILHNGLRNYVCDVTRDGATAIITTISISGRFVLSSLSIASGVLTPIGAPHSSRLNAKLSPDERWLAYVSNDTGRREVYVSSYPDARGMTRVSVKGGQMPYWSADGRKLYYASGDLTQILATDVRAHDTQFEVGESHVLVNVHVKRSENTQFVVTPDGSRILVNTVDADPLMNPLTLVENWMTRVK